MKVLTILLVLAGVGLGQAWGQICKIVDANGEYSFITLNDAMSFARSGVSSAMSASNPLAIQMLTDYLVLQTDLVILNVMGDNNIITMADTGGGTYNFIPTNQGDTIASLTHGWNGDTLFNVN